VTGACPRPSADRSSTGRVRSCARRQLCGRTQRLHIGGGRFLLGLRLADQAAPGLRRRRTLGAADVPGSDDFGPKSVV
jgi:hypothetical protein